MSTEEGPRTEVAIDSLWSSEWDHLDALVRDHACACCGARGHYQAHLESVIAQEGFQGGVALGGNGKMFDGTHRIIAAHRLGIVNVPIETEQDARDRWRRDQEALKAHVGFAPVPCEVWRWANATSEAGYERANPRPARSRR